MPGRPPSMSYSKPNCQPCPTAVSSLEPTTRPKRSQLQVHENEPDSGTCDNMQREPTSAMSGLRHKAGHKQGAATLETMVQPHTNSNLSEVNIHIFAWFCQIALQAWPLNWHRVPVQYAGAPWWAHFTKQVPRSPLCLELELQRVS